MKIALVLLALVWWPFPESTTPDYKFSGKSKIAISGTSTLHDWIMETSSVQGEANIELSDHKILSIHNIKVKVPVETLKSGKNSMDKNAYEALNSEKFPHILFTLTGFQQISQNNGKSKLEVTGNLTISGTTRTEKILVEYETDDKGNLYCRGSKDLKMTDYGVKPPEVMFGTIKTGNEITIHFDIYLDDNSTI